MSRPSVNWVAIRRTMHSGVNRRRYTALETQQFHHTSSMNPQRISDTQIHHWFRRSRLTWSRDDTTCRSVKIKIEWEMATVIVATTRITAARIFPSYSLGGVGVHPV